VTTPHGSAPDGAWQFASGFGQGMTEDEALALATGGARGNLENADLEWGLVRQDLDNLRDEQLQFGERLDLLEGVNGYCNLFMSANWQVAQNQLLTLPFDTQLGPRVGASPHSGDAILLESRGLWRADLHVSADKMTNSNYRANVYISVINSVSGTVFTETQFDLVLTPSGSETAAFSKTFVIPDDNTYLVRARIQHNRTARLKVFGGTLRSALTVNKWSSNTSNLLVLDTVPDGGELG
jgi:hypothetical protein